MPRGKPLDGSKNPGGRPRDFDDAESLQEAFDRYFNSISIDEPRFKAVLVGYEDAEQKKPIYNQVPVLNNNGEQVIDTRYFEHPSVIKMAHYIGTTKDTLLNYAKEEKYFSAIKKTKEKIEAYLENELFREQGQVTGTIFNLKNNFGWTDKQEIESTNTNINYNYEAELQDLIK